MNSNERTAAIGGSVLLALVLVLTAVRVGDDETVGYAIGYAFGAVTLALIVALALRFAWVRLRGQGEVVSGWLALLTAIVAMGFSIANAAGEANDENERATDRLELAGDECIADQPPPVADGDGIRFRELSAALRAQVLATAPETVSTEDVVLRQAVVDGSPSGVAFAYPGILSEEDRDGFIAGVRGSAASQGYEAADLELGGETVTMVTLPVGALVAGFNGCYAWVVQGTTSSEARRLAERVLAS